MNPFAMKTMIRLPTLLIHEAQDKVAPLEHTWEASNLIPSAILKAFDHCGHCSQIEKATEFNKTVADFLRSDKPQT